MRPIDSINRHKTEVGVRVWPVGTYSGDAGGPVPVPVGYSHVSGLPLAYYRDAVEPGTFSYVWLNLPGGPRVDGQDEYGYFHRGTEIFTLDEEG